MVQRSARIPAIMYTLPSTPERHPISTVSIIQLRAHRNNNNIYLTCAHSMDGDERQLNNNNNNHARQWDILSWPGYATNPFHSVYAHESLYYIHYNNILKHAYVIRVFPYKTTCSCVRARPHTHTQRTYYIRVYRITGRTQPGERWVEGDNIELRVVNLPMYNIYYTRWCASGRGRPKRRVRRSLGFFDAGPWKSW